MYSVAFIWEKARADAVKQAGLSAPPVERWSRVPYMRRRGALLLPLRLRRLEPRRMKRRDRPAA